ncbi:hypothetical protein KJZ63_00515 [Patescibacteria group bacterium]|nr:hypothetical protein [Patescibacteria group bacterium]
MNERLPNASAAGLRQMKKIILLLKSGIYPFIQIIGLNLLALLAFLGINGDTIKNQIKSHFNNNLLLIFFFFVSGIFFWLLVEKIFEIIKNYQKLVVKAEIEKINLQTNILDIQSAIPSSEVIKIWMSNLYNHSKKWSNDAEISEFNMYFDFDGKHWTTPTFQATFYSEWKNETATFYEGGLNNESFEEDKPIGYAKTTPFIECIPNWRNLLIHAFAAVSTRINNNCTIQIHTTGINISFSEGKLKKRSSFHFIQSESGEYQLKKIAYDS